MALKERIAENNASQKRDTALMEMYKSDRDFRADTLVESWSRVPEIGAGLKQLPLTEARNTAINLDREYSWMKSLKETEKSTALADFAPENMLRLVRLAMPALIRSKVFTEMALEGIHDSLKYIRPFWSKSADGIAQNDRDPSFGGAENEDYDPWKYAEGGDFNGEDYRKALYEDTRDRHNGELVNAPVKFDKASNTLTAYFLDLSTAADAVKAGFSKEAVTLSGKWGKDGANYIDGYTYIFGYNPSDKNTVKAEQQVVAIQDRTTGKFFGAPGFHVELKKAPLVRDKFLMTAKTPHTVAPATEDNGLEAALETTGVLAVEITVDATVAAKEAPWYKEGVTEFRVAGRFNSEHDLKGNYLGEVELRMSEYTFRPSATTIGVSWTQMTEITMDTSFGSSAEDTLISYASQTVREALDIRAIRLAYMTAKANASFNPNYIYEFDANFTSVVSTPAGGEEDNAGTKDSYIANAQTFVSAIDAVGDVMYDEIKRGGVSRMVAGPSACSYLRLYNGFSPVKGIQNGPYQFGTVDEIPLFKVPSDVIPTNEVLCLWKNDQEPTDVAIVFGTLIPFFSTGVLQRKNFYKEAGLATYGDWNVLNRRYLALIRINGMKDYNNKKVFA